MAQELQPLGARKEGKIQESSVSFLLLKAPAESPGRTPRIALVVAQVHPWSLPTLPPFLGRVPHYNMSHSIEPYNAFPSDKY